MSPRVPTTQLHGSQHVSYSIYTPARPVLFGQSQTACHLSICVVISESSPLPLTDGHRPAKHHSDQPPPASPPALHALLLSGIG